MSIRLMHKTITASVGCRAVIVIGMALTVAACAPTAPSSSRPATSQGPTTFETLNTPGTGLAIGHGVESTAMGQGPQACVPDTKLLGRIEISVDDRPYTWWWLTKQRFDALGVTDYKKALEDFFGRDFSDLSEAVQFLIDGVRTFDKNANGFVCGYSIPGTRANLGTNALFLFGVADDKHAAE
jgi:hypothetical protein